jgi:hypothetical protein
MSGKKKGMCRHEKAIFPTNANTANITQCPYGKEY